MKGSFWFTNFKFQHGPLRPGLEPGTVRLQGRRLNHVSTASVRNMMRFLHITPSCEMTTSQLAKNEMLRIYYGLFYFGMQCVAAAA
jgi:hypothetical protein